MHIKALTHLLLGIHFAFAREGEGGDLPPRNPRASNEADIVEAARYAVEELKELSDSGVYRTLELSRIINASTQEGIFHDNTFLFLELASQHLKSGPSVVFELMVMKHRDDGTFSFAIDEFPEMTEDSIELFYNEKVERQKALREGAFKAMELEVLRGRESSSGVEKDIDGLSTDELLGVLAEDTDEARVQAVLRLIEERWEGESYADLPEKSASSLLEISNDQTQSESRRSAAGRLLRARAAVASDGEL